MRAAGLVCVLAWVPGCFDGEGTLGGACERNDDCGGDQRCERSVCGLCGDGVAQAGELCLRGPETTTVDATAPSLAALDVDGDGTEDVVWPTSSGLAVARRTDDGFDTPRERSFDATGVWAGDFDGDGTEELLVRDSNAGATLWRPDGSGEFTADTSVELEPLRGLTAAALNPSVGILVRQPRSVARLSSEMLTTQLSFDDDVTHLVAQAGGDAAVVLGGRSLVGLSLGVSIEQEAEQTFERPILDAVSVAWNADRRDDVVVLLNDGTAQVWLRDDDGSFIAGPSRGLARNTTRLGVFDITEDQQPDVLGYGPGTDLRASIHRNGDLDVAMVLDDGAWTFILPVRSAAGLRTDVVLHDGRTLSILRRDA